MKSISIACAYLMVIAAFYVMTANVSANDVDPLSDIVDEAVSSIDNIDRRITISNVMASSPIVAVGPDGETHVAWVDGSPGSQSVCWKRSNDSMSTFTSDETITTSFYSISNVTMVLGSAFGIVIAFEGRQIAEASPTVYFLYSSDGDDWSSAYAVSVGNAPSLATDGDSVFIALNVMSEGVERYSFASLRLIDSAVNATLVAALPVSASGGDIAFFKGMLNVAMIERESNSLYFMQLTDNGTVVTEPTLVRKTGGGTSVGMTNVNGDERILFVDNDSIMLACCLGQPENWMTHTVLELNATIADASLAVSNGSMRISYATVSSSGSDVYVVECDPQGNAGESRLISTPGLDASSPSIFSITDGSFSCIYAEEHSGAQELFLKQDIDYVIPDITRLPGYIMSLDYRLFRQGNDSASELMDRVNVTIAYNDNSQESLAIENATELEEDLDSYFVSTPYANLDEVEAAQETISANLETVSSSGMDEVSNKNALSPFDPPGGVTYVESSFVFDLEPITNKMVFARWYYAKGGFYASTPEYGIAGYLVWGTSLTNMSHQVNGTKSDSHLPIGYTTNLADLNANTTYYAQAYVITSTETYNSSICSFSPYPDSINIQNISITLSAGCATIKWTTNGKSDSRVDYGTTSSYGNNRYNDELEYSHSVTINNLASSTFYHYKIISTYSAEGFSVNASSADQTFTSAQVTLTISSVSVVLTDLNAVCVTWSTDTVSSSRVEYGTTTAYGSYAYGGSGTSHVVDIDGLSDNTLYHFRVRSISTVSSSVVKYSSDSTFTTKYFNDADLNDDAGDEIGSASNIAPGSYIGYLDSSFDTNDYYAISLINGQTIKITLDVPSSFDYQLYLLDPSGIQVSSSTNDVSIDESIQYDATVSGSWTIHICHSSGSDQGFYSLTINMLGGNDWFGLDVGAAGDDDYAIQGLTLLTDPAWGSISSGMRQASANGSSFLLNIYDGTYQSSSYYQLSIAYCASADIGVQVLVGDSWITVATMPGNSAATANTYSFVLKNDWLSDSSDTLLGCNVRFRFDHAVIIDSIDAMAVAYASDIFGDSQNYPGVMLGNNWAIGDSVVNGSASATLVITLPRTDQTYMLEFTSLDTCTGIGVQQYVGTAYTSIGTLESWGASSVIQLNPSYTDVLTSMPGTSVQIRLTSALVNLTNIVLWTSRYYTDVGASGDTIDSTHTPGISILDNGEWGAITTMSGVTFRTTVSGNKANFHLNGAESDVHYIISITYKVTSGTTYIKQYVSSSSAVVLGSLTTGSAWRTATFVASSINYDHIAGGQVNALFEIDSTTTVSVDSITVHKDSDGDGINDAVEALRVTMSTIGTHTYDLDPFSADTDSDGLDDNVEMTASYGTDPTDADSDNDGLLDGSEKYSYTWSANESYLIPDNATLTISLSLPAISGTVTALCLIIGITHGVETQLKVQISKGTGRTRTIKASGTGSGANYYACVNLFKLPSSYSSSDLTAASTWNIKVTDVTRGTEGHVQYARLQVNGTTGPLDADSDNDGILDGEEVEFGNDGWYTNPCSMDSDGDGIKDADEIAGSTPCGSATDPTRADTDDDGYADNIDLYMGDAVLRVTILKYKTLENINNDDDRTIFFVIKYNGEMLSTKRMAAHTDTLYYPGWTYDIDIAETVTSVSVTFSAVADSAGLIQGDDIKLDVSPTDNSEQTITWALSTTQYRTSFQGIGVSAWDSDADAYMKVGLQRCVAEKAKVIVINGTGDDGDYGLDTVSTGVYRYSADDQVYLINLNVSTANARFQKGMNTIILPRAIALQCQLNDTLYDLRNVGSTPLAGASFYSTDQDVTSASSHVIAVITKNVTAAQAEAILKMLTHNSTGARIGNNVSVSSTSLYLMHLPDDILSSIPTNVVNSGLGEAPDYFDPLGVISDIASMVFDFLVWVATGGILLLWVHLVEIGLGIIENLITSAIAAVEAAVDVIVDAFCAFVDWIIEFILSSVKDFFSPIIDEITNAIRSYGQRVNASFFNIEMDIMGSGQTTSDSLLSLQYSLLSDLFILMLTVGIAIQVLIAVIIIATIGMSFLLSVAISTIVGYTIYEIIKSNEFQEFAGNVCDGITGLYEWMCEFFGPGYNPPSNVQIAWTAFGSCMSIVSIVYNLPELLGGNLVSGICFAISIISIVIGLYGTATSSVGMGLLGIALASIGLISSIKDFVKSNEPSERILALIVSSFGLIGIYCSEEAL